MVGTLDIQADLHYLHQTHCILNMDYLESLPLNKLISLHVYFASLEV